MLIQVLLQKISKNCSSNLTKDATYLTPQFKKPSVILIDEQDDIAYIGFSTEGNIVISRFDLLEFKVSDSIYASTINAAIVSGHLDKENGFLYFGTDSETLTVIKVDFVNFEIVEEKSLITLPNSHLATSVFDVANDMIYFGVNDDNDTYVIKVSSPDLSVQSNISYNDSQISQGAIDVSHGFMYFLLSDSVGGSSFAKIQISNFAPISNVSITQTSIKSLVLDSQHEVLFCGTYSIVEGYGVSDSAVCQVDLSDFSFRTCIGINDTNGFPTGFLEPSGSFVYFASDDSPIQIFKFSSSSLEVIENITLTSGNDFAWSSAADTSTGFVYIGTDQEPTRLVKIQAFTPPDPTPSPPPSSSNQIVFSILFFGFLVLLNFYD
ncbi:hypothetical protein M0811_11920 [Anaeramoeba ignava]|uniref:Uncharacterized protein n=1 Tax=Anaeramoeba ignava TaxID=1746090 RepID=A0A9Q0R7X3_ANAIG|nr:hypothetical protein M0811_11920 [Anaeramoeba ignava]